MPFMGALIGGGLGLVGSMMDDGTQTVQNTVPPEFSGLASQVAQRGEQLGNLPYQPYPYATVADFNPYQYMGFDMTANRAMQGWGLPQQAEQGLMRTIGGGYGAPGGVNAYAGPNKYLEDAISGTMGDMSKQFNMNVAPSMAAASLRGGSFGNAGLQEAENATRSQLAQDMGRVAGGMRMQDYTTQQGLAESALNRQQSGWDSERNRMMSAMGMSPSIYGLGYQPAQMMQGIGGTMQQQGQNELNSWQNQFNQSQEWPFKTYQAMMAPFGQNIGSTQTQTGMGSNPVAGMMGGAMMGNKMFEGW